MSADQLFDPDTVGMARSTDPETSHGAAVIALGRAAWGRRAVLEYLLRAGDHGMSDFELAAATGVQQTSIGKRRGECRDAGLVRQACDEAGKTVTRPSPTNSPAIVWRLTASGIIEAESLAAGCGYLTGPQT